MNAGLLALIKNLDKFLNSAELSEADQALESITRKPVSPSLWKLIRNDANIFEMGLTYEDGNTWHTVTFDKGRKRGRVVTNQNGEEHIHWGFEQEITDHWVFLRSIPLFNS